MRTSENNIRQLLEMLDNPDDYSEQDIRDAINRDEETRETYRLMAEAKRSSRHRQDNNPADADAAWQRFKERGQVKVKSEKLPTARPAAQPNSQFSILNSQFRKIAASFIGVLLVTGIAFAAIHIVSHSDSPKEQDTIAPAASRHPAVTTRLSEADTIATPQPKLYDNVPLGEMFDELADYYHIKVAYRNEATRLIRLFYQWRPDYTIERVVGMLNNFEWLQLELENDTLSVSSTIEPQP